jgi:hypothetical protein
LRSSNRKLKPLPPDPFRHQDYVDTIVGKIRLSQTPWLNHSWQVPLYVTVHGLAISPIRMANERSKSTSFIDHALLIETSDGPRWKMPLHAKSFHAAIVAALSDVGIEAHIDEIPNELPDPITAALIVARVAQGVGGALLVPGTLAIISAAHLTQYQLIGIIPSGGY